MSIRHGARRAAVRLVALGALVGAAAPWHAVNAQRASSWNVGLLASTRRTGVYGTDLEYHLRTSVWGRHALAVDLNALGLLETERIVRGTMGLGLTPRYSVSIGTVHANRLRAEMGIGTVLYSRPFPAGGTRFNLTRIAGVVAQSEFGELSIVTSVRWYHSSNQNMRGLRRNPGFDALGVYFSVVDDR